MDTSKNDTQTDAPLNPEPPIQQPIVSPPPKKSRKKILLVILAIVLLGGAVGAGWWLGHRSKPAKTVSSTQSQSSQTTKAPTTAPTVQGLQLDAAKNYGNKYANGLLPVGDGKYQTTGAKQGYVYTCSQYASNLSSGGGGAMARGPWFTNNNTEYDLNKKVAVQGSVMWHGSLTNTVSGSTRTIVSNDLPLSDPTGTFPIQSSDPAYQYDRNPNAIKTQAYTFGLTANPAYSATPTCESGTVGVMLTGVELFNGFDAGGRDAGAWEVQDDCNGHPQEQGAYHYHTLSSCIKDTSVHTVIGFALDGFPITGPTVSANNILTTADLDECHGIVSPINLDGKNVTMYHYVMTQDFPYSVSCFRGTPITPPGQGAQQQAQTQGQIPNQGGVPPRR